MKSTILVDNIPGEKLEAEWGLSVFIEFDDKKILLDTGASNLFIENAKKLSLDVSCVDYAVLSHAHWDHANGMPYFFKVNSDAKFYLQKCCGENCYAEKENGVEYIGIPLGIQEEMKKRLIYVSGKYELCEGVYLIPHKTKGLEKCGERSRMFVKDGDEFIPDAFNHEQSLVFEAKKGLVIFSSCSHGGADVIINEVADTFPDKNIIAMIGGFHLFDKTEEEIKKLAEGIKKTGIKKIFTGHCTGELALEILKNELGEIVEGFYTGCVMEF